MVQVATIPSVDGNKLGSVFTIGTTDSNIDVTLSGLGITGGSGTQVGYFTNGGGVFNKGRTVIKNSRIFANSAVYGGGVENWGTARLVEARSPEILPSGAGRNG